MSDRTVLVTGGSGGLGSAVTATLRASGWRVVSASRRVRGGTADDRPAPGDATVAGPAVTEVAADLTEPDGAAAAVQHAVSDPDAPLRAVVNLVGGYHSAGLIHDTPVADFDQMLRVNLRPTYLVTRAALPYLIDAGDGAIVCVSSRAAGTPFAGAAGYVTAKAAVQAFAAAVAVEYRQFGVRCNTVAPGVIDTPANRRQQPAADHGAWVDPLEIASVVRFLISADSAPTSGAVIPVYGRG
ncbi:SDR family NAD(P)-dependent oxidoreductase [Solwaraspora sp. WMMD406]|uniref:SDR family NAD(P)-dependent oxidoreductase n=1 Tax=Solwaraspora sp. WMMD406 TaxID=3016095 RepID=UPI0024165A74|nr:SDR family NAD(P)-dependent oxidoreductase [Solwaraspora sp. WMMD406]MDG4767380.1 SDR family NAD(P)-dependent oxidoreductase [Solwaraspora sp. WMMD406]